MPKRQTGRCTNSAEYVSFQHVPSSDPSFAPLPTAIKCAVIVRLRRHILHCVCCATDGRRDGPPHLFQAFSVADEIVPNPGPVHFDARFAHTVPWQIGWQLRPGDTLKVQRLAEGRPAGQPLLFTLSGEESQHVFVTLAAPELSAVP